MRLLRFKAHVVCAIFAVALATSFVVTPKALAFAGSGTGTSGDPYQITTCVQLQDMQSDLAAYYKLMNDIDCSTTSSWNGGLGFEPVGSTANEFAGTLDGNNRTISSLFINRPANHYIGLFGRAFGSGSISNLTLANVNITGADNTGTLIGNVLQSDVTISNVSASGTVNGGYYVGGLVGDFEGGSVTNSNSAVTITALGDAGGLLGYAYYCSNGSGTISDSYATGNVTVSNTWLAGGLIGENYCQANNTYATGNVTGDQNLTGDVGGLMGYTDANVSRSYATGNVSGSDYVGGLIGELDSPGNITDSYATGDVTGNTRVGGFIGDSEGAIANSFSIGSVTAGTTEKGGFIGNNTGTMTNSFWGIDSSGMAIGCDVASSTDCNGIAGKTTTEMKALSTFDSAGWDITTTTTNRNNGYPFLSWETGGTTPTWLVYVAPMADGSGVAGPTIPQSGASLADTGQSLLGVVLVAVTFIVGGLALVVKKHYIKI